MKKVWLILSFIGFQVTTLTQSNDSYDFYGKMIALVKGISLEESQTEYPKIQTLGNIACGLVAGAIQPFCGFHGIEDEDGASYMLHGTPKAFNYAVAAGVLAWIPGLTIAYFKGA